MEQYKNKEYLTVQYVDNELNTCQIAELCNCDAKTVWNWLKKLNITMRPVSKAHCLSFIKKIGNDNYCNKSWLQQKYLVEKLSPNQIGKLCNCSKTTIYRWLKEFNVSMRSKSKAFHLRQANYCKLSDEALQWIDGELLGDGSLRSLSKYSASFGYSSKYLEYIQHISDTLKSFGIKQCGKIQKAKDKRWNCNVYHYSSLSYVELLPIRKRWYPKGKKIIPRNLKLTSLVLKQEYIGDGCLDHRKNRKSSIRLYTNGFPISDVEWLAKELSKLGFKSTRQPSHNTIGISSYSTKEFLNYIRDCPVECYKYKWDYERKIS